jgi:hypothetical protein
MKISFKRPTPRRGHLTVNNFDALEAGIDDDEDCSST